MSQNTIIINISILLLFSFSFKQQIGVEKYFKEAFQILLFKHSPALSFAWKRQCQKSYHGNSTWFCHAFTNGWGGVTILGDGVVLIMQDLPSSVIRSTSLFY